MEIIIIIIWILPCVNMDMGCLGARDLAYQGENFST